MNVCARALNFGSTVAATLILALSPFVAIAEPHAKFATDEIREGRFVVKLKAAPAERAIRLPVDGLPEGLPELDDALREHAIRDGRRMIGEHGAPLRDPALFKKVGLDRIYVFEVPGASQEKIRALVDEFSRLSWVEYAEPVYIGRLMDTVPNDSMYPDQWSHDNTGQTGGTPDADMDSPEGWDFGTGSAAAIVAILDSGVDLDHPDLVDNLIAGYDFYNDDSDPEDDHGHGTGAAGIAAARGNNAIGVAGVCWSCSIMPVKVCSAGGYCASDAVADGMVFAADNGADAISMSFSTHWTQAVVDAVDYATGLGALCFVAAGNDGGYHIHFPGALPQCVAVGGSDHNDERLYCYGDQSEITTPSIVPTTELGGGYMLNAGGTSAACPHAAGAAALLRSIDPGLHGREVRHLLRLGADDQVGIPAEDTPGWDQFMGYGRLNIYGSASLIHGPWISLDRPHYLCGGELTVALKDESAGSSVAVTLTGGVGGDSETLDVTPVTGNGYYEGTIPISWAGKDGPVVIGNGVLDLAHEETVTATAGALVAGAFTDCLKRVCPTAILRSTVAGDCDGDRTADPGESWELDVVLHNRQTEEMHDVTLGMESSDPSIVSLQGGGLLGDLPPEYVVSGTVRFYVSPTATPQSTTSLSLNVSGRGWEADPVECALVAPGLELDIPVHRDLGAALGGWDFDDGTAMGWTHGPAHGTGDLAECDGTWSDGWGSDPVTDRAHSGTHSMRLGNGSDYALNLDAGLTSPIFLLPAGGGAVGFYLWMDTDIWYNTALPFTGVAGDGVVVEAKGRFDTTWTYLDDVTYNAASAHADCFWPWPPLGAAGMIRMFGGEGGSNPALGGDTFDQEHLAAIPQFAGGSAQLRFRFASDDYSVDSNPGVWVDTITRYDSFTADTWPAVAPANAAGDDAGCPTSFEVDWDPVAGATDYAIYRSEISCADALQLVSPLDTPAAPPYSDTTVVEDVAYYYAIEAREPGTTCVTERSCVEGGCVCLREADPTGLLVDRGGNDVELSWDDPAVPAVTWNVYRETDPDRTGWTTPHDTGVTDGDGGEPGIQYVDVDGVGAGTLQYYLTTAVNECGESPL